MTNFKSMMLVRGYESFTGTQKATFRMIPVSNDCPYIEAVFDTTNMVLGIIGKFKKSNYEMVPVLNKEGDLVPKKRKIKEGEFPFCQEKRMIESWNEYQIVTKEEILEFVKMFAVNADTFDVEPVFAKALEDLAERTKKVPVPERVELKATVTEKELVN